MKDEYDDLAESEQFGVVVRKHAHIEYHIILFFVSMSQLTRA